MAFSAPVAELKILARFENTGLGFLAQAELHCRLNPSPCNRKFDFVSAFQYLTIRTRYRKLRQIFPNKQLKLIRRKFITALTYDATKQNDSNNLCHAILTLAKFENSQLFKMRDSLTFSRFKLFIRRCFFL